MTKTTKTTRTARATIIATISDAEIREHPLLDAMSKNVCRRLRDIARRERRPFTMHHFACIALRATARDFVEMVDQDGPPGGREVRQRDLAMRSAAALYAFEELSIALPTLVGATQNKALFAHATAFQLMVANELMSERLKLARARRPRTTRSPARKRR